MHRRRNRLRKLPDGGLDGAGGRDIDSFPWDSHYLTTLQDMNRRNFPFWNHFFSIGANRRKRNSGVSMGRKLPNLRTVTPSKRIHLEDISSKTDKYASTGWNFSESKRYHGIHRNGFNDNTHALRIGKDLAFGMPNARVPQLFTRRAISERYCRIWGIE
ncbi:MAG: hypothetical protein QG650_970 [Patescibacteria group bacterium]|nr:hypothetical protein [Patescibacteria group bacterium]